MNPLLSVQSLAAFQAVARCATANTEFMKTPWVHSGLIGDLSETLQDPERMTRLDAAKAFRLIREAEGILPKDLLKKMDQLKAELINIGVADAFYQTLKTSQMVRYSKPNASVFRNLGGYLEKLHPNKKIDPQEDLEFDVMEFRRQPMITARGIAIEYPFPDPPVAWKWFREEPHEYRLAILRHIDTKGELVPATLGERLDGSREGSTGVVFSAREGQVIKIYDSSPSAERLIAIQRLLELEGIPHIEMVTSPLALMLARQGVVVQKRFPPDSRLLHPFAGYFRSIEEMYCEVEKSLGSEARRRLETFLEKLEEIRMDTQLRDQSVMRGFSVAASSNFATLREFRLEDTTPVDVHGGGGSYLNVAWHQSIGWFLFDW